MENLIKYFCYKGLSNFTPFKFERKSRMIIKEHFVSNKDVKKFYLYGYVILDKYGRYKLPKYILKKIDQLIVNISYGYLVDLPKQKRGLSFKEIEYYLLHPNEKIYKYLIELQTNIDKDIIKSRFIKLMNIKNKLKEING